MPAATADLTISSRWMLPMTAPYAVLEEHALVVRDGRILDVLPNSLAAEHYASAVVVDRSEHLLLPGLINGWTRGAAPQARGHGTPPVDERAHADIAGMLEAGVTCCLSLGYFPEQTARTAAEQGMRAVIGIPIAETASPWADGPGEYLTRALSFRDEFRGHPRLATVFAPQSPVDIGDDTFRRIATLADELDAGIVIALHDTRAQIEASLARHGTRPIARLDALGLLTPALTAVHMLHVNDADRTLAERSGIAVICCPEADLRSGEGVPPLAAWAAAGLRLGLGSGNARSTCSLDPWTALRLFALLSGGSDTAAWNALAAATRGGAAALGLDAQIGTLETGKWADACCIDLSRPALHGMVPGDAAARLAFAGGRDLVSDVWVAGRQLLDGGAFTRLDWPPRAAGPTSTH